MSKKVKILIGVIAILIIISIFIVSFCLINFNKTEKTAKIDDWVYNKNDEIDSYISSSGSSVFSVTTAAESSLSSSSKFSDSNIGFSVGGSKNVNNFRENIKNGYFPISTDITYNGLFYDYYFETGDKKTSEEMFYPSYSTAVSKDPISSNSEYYMTVGLNSNIKQSDFKRKKQNIVVLLDISGSMESSLNSYYYDNSLLSKFMDNKSKMQLANESVNLMIDELKDDDRLAMVLFDDDAYLAKNFNLIKDTDISKLKNHILEIEACGGTNFEKGYKKATELFSNELLDDKEYDNRIIVITDAMPNMGTTNKSELSKYIESNSGKGIYTSFIGVGVDFNTEVIESLSNVKGANYYSISSSKQFKKILGEEFDYMVTPLVFDLNLNFESDGYEIDKIYGTDSQDKSYGNIMKVNTLFPSNTNEDSEAKGGVILLKLKKKENGTNNKIKLNVSYTDRDGNQHTNSQVVEFNKDDEYYENTGIRKAICLTRYANVLKNWILYERSNENDKFYIDENFGIVDCEYSKDEIRKLLGENERTSVKLTVSDKYKDIFKKIKDYLENEKNEVKDESLKQETELLEKLINS